MTTRYERHTGKLAGPKFNQHPYPRRRPADSVQQVGNPEAEQKRAVRELEKMQAGRPRKPPGRMT